MRHRHLYILALVLTVAGVALFAYKAIFLGVPLTPEERAQAWDVEVRLSFIAADGPVKLTTFIPRSSGRLSVLDQRFITRGYGVSSSAEGSNRRAVFSTRRARGEQFIYVRFVVHQAAPDYESSARIDQPAVPPHQLEGARLQAAGAILDSARAQSADLPTLGAALLRLLNDRAKGDAAGILLGADPTPERIAQTAVKVLALGGTPARQVNGIPLQEADKDTQVVHWLEAFGDGKWISFDVRTAELGAPAGTLPWWRGSEPFASLTGGRRLQTQIAVAQLDQPALERVLLLGGGTQDVVTAFSPLGLPLATQHVYRVLLVIPIGIFLLALLRNVVGVKTFGTFMPVLMALAFRETQLVWGLVLFTIVVALGLAFRFYLDRLKLLLVPRLAAVLIAVVLIMLLLSLTSHRLGMERGLSVALFPMVILTMTIERMSIVWDERGPAEALQQGLGSLTVAVLCYAVMNVVLLEHLFFVFPETLLVLLAATLLLGRYSGYRLTEVRRFKVLAETRDR